jgi:hypothetical protein
MPFCFHDNVSSVLLLSTRQWSFCYCVANNGLPFALDNGPILGEPVPFFASAWSLLSFVVINNGHLCAVNNGPLLHWLLTFALWNGPCRCQDCCVVAIVCIISP